MKTRQITMFFDTRSQARKAGCKVVDRGAASEGRRWGRVVTSTKA